jgi:MoaA/NifB/PqqE/SkfB family radical SAM enzyme
MSVHKPLPLDAALLRQYNESRSADVRERVCHAPFQSLRFSASGNIYTCCFNRHLKLGSYPHDRLIDVWQGEKLRSLRKCIELNDLGQGCHFCRESLVRGLFHSVGARNYDLSPFKEQDFPRILDFELSNICNLKCIMCSGENSSTIREHVDLEENFPQAYDEAFVEELRPFLEYAEEARFSGGEPFLSEVCLQIWEHIRRLHPFLRVFVQTNGTVNTPRIVELARSMNMHVSFSIDSLLPGRFEKIRRGAKFDKVMETFHQFYQYSRSDNKEISVSFCLMKENLSEALSYIDYFNTLDVPVVFHQVVFPPELSMFELSEKELDSIAYAIDTWTPVSDTPYRRRNVNLMRDLARKIRARAGKEQLDHDNLLQKNADELALLFADKLTRYAGAHMGDSKLAGGYIEKLHHLIAGIHSEENKISALLRVLKIPPAYILAELESGDTQRILSRLIKSTDR